MADSPGTSGTTAEGSHDDLVLVERAGRIARVSLNRPERRNALTGPLAVALADTIETLNGDDELTVIVLKGQGGAFCSGLDLKEFGAEPQPEWVPRFGAEWQRVHRALFDSNKMVVGALERAAVNGGAALAIACDFLICGRTAFLQVGEIQQGMAAPMNMAWLRLRYSEALAARVALLGDRLDGATLAGLGMVHDVVDDDQVVAAADELAERLAQHDPGGVHRIKTMLRRVGTEHDAAGWFQRALESDPLAGRSMKPQAARPV